MRVPNTTNPRAEIVLSAKAAHWVWMRLAMIGVPLIGPYKPEEDRFNFAAVRVQHGRVWCCYHSGDRSIQATAYFGDQLAQGNGVFGLVFIPFLQTAALCPNARVHYQCFSTAKQLGFIRVDETLPPGSGHAGALLELPMRTWGNTLDPDGMLHEQPERQFYELLELIGTRGYLALPLPATYDIWRCNDLVGVHAQFEADSDGELWVGTRKEGGL